MRKHKQVIAYSWRSGYIQHPTTQKVIFILHTLAVHIKKLDLDLL